MKLRIPESDDLTLDDLETLEDICGKSFTEVFSDFAANKVSAKAIKALVFLQERRVNKAFTLEMVGRLSLDDIEIEAPESNGGKAVEGSGET